MIAEDNKRNEEEKTMLEVYIAKFHNASFYKHWALYVEKERPHHKNSFICHVQGAPGIFRYAETNLFARGSRSIEELYHLGWISERDGWRFQDVCAAVEVKNDHVMNWNCQDWVFDAISALVSEGILVLDAGVTEDAVIQQMDGLD